MARILTDKATTLLVSALSTWARDTRIAIAKADDGVFPESLKQQLEYDADLCDQLAADIEGRTLEVR